MEWLHSSISTHLWTPLEAKTSKYIYSKLYQFHLTIHGYISIKENHLKNHTWRYIHKNNYLKLYYQNSWKHCIQYNKHNSLKTLNTNLNTNKLNTMEHAYICRILTKSIYFAWYNVSYETISYPIYKNYETILYPI